jgi:hypothetical protein
MPRRLFNDLDGIVLGEPTRWVITGLHEYEPFFRNVGHLLPDPTTILYLEGVAIAPDVRSFLRAFTSAGCSYVHLSSWR